MNLLSGHYLGRVSPVLILGTALLLGTAMEFELNVSAQKKKEMKSSSGSDNSATSGAIALSNTARVPTSGVSEEIDAPISINMDLVSLTVTVTDRHGRYISGIDKAAFTIRDNQNLQDITFFSDEDAALSVCILFDLSSSMGGNKFEYAREALSRFIRTSGEMDEYVLIGFNSHLQILQDKTRDAQALLKTLAPLHPGGMTALYDACYMGIERAGRATYEKRVILLVTDGRDTGSAHTHRQVLRLLKESGVPVYAVGIEKMKDSDDINDFKGEAILSDLASSSGGAAFFPQSSEEMDEAFERIATELRHQYSVGYRPRNFQPNGKWHHVEIGVKPPSGFTRRLRVRSRRGYFAVKRQL